MLDTGPHDPDEQTRFVPQVVPSALRPAALHAGFDQGFSHVVVPVAHGFVGWQDWFATQAAMHAPPEQTRPDPHAVPSPFAPAGVQVPGVVEDAQVIVPSRQGLGGWQFAPALHVTATHDPPLHTCPAPQPMPSGLLDDTTQLGVANAVEHVVVPAVQGFEGWQGAPATQVGVAHAPSLQTFPLPHVVPSGTFPVAAHRAAPVAQLMVPW